MLVYFKQIFVFGALISFTWARPEAPPTDESPNVQAVEIPTDANKEVVPIPTEGVIYGLIINTSPDHIKSIESETVSAETPETSSPSGGKLVRKKRFLFNLLGSALQLFRNDNWRECGRTPWGTTIYTNGFATACYGACPENVYCGYGYDGYGYGYGGRYGSQLNYVHIG